MQISKQELEPQHGNGSAEECLKEKPTSQDNSFALVCKGTKRPAALAVALQLNSFPRFLACGRAL